MTCYTAIHEEEGSKRAARMTLERVERALSHDPTIGAAIANGACSLAVLGEEERAREWIERGLLLDPDNQYMRYNVACVLTAQLKDDGAAMDVLEPFFAQVNTASQLKHVEADPDLERLRDKPRFDTMLATAKQRLGLSGGDQNAPAMPLMGTK